MKEIKPNKICSKCKIGLFLRNFNDDDIERSEEFYKPFGKQDFENVPSYSCQVYYCPKCFKQFIEKEEC